MAAINISLLAVVTSLAKFSSGQNRAVIKVALIIISMLVTLRLAMSRAQVLHDHRIDVACQRVPVLVARRSD